ncbi:MAG TPA: hypothetical protein DCX43_10415, partial [Psychrobacter sp.]|nr:hypothetical protein [Psychrobacter sp.]
KYPKNATISAVRDVSILLFTHYVFIKLPPKKPAHYSLMAGFFCIYLTLTINFWQKRVEG